MPDYLFSTPSGGTVEHFCSASEVPSIGEELEINGEMCVRLASYGQPLVKRNIAFTSHQIDQWHPDAPRHNKHGEAVFHSRKEADEFGKKAGMEYDQL